MAWARLDDTFHDHTKVQDALDEQDGLAALGLWTLALSRSYAPGVERPLVLAREVRRLVPGHAAAALAAVLVRVGLWEEHPDGYLIHDWGKFRPRQELTPEARAKGGRNRAAQAARGGGGQFTAQVDHQVAPGGGEPVGNPLPGEHQATPGQVSRYVPSHPVVTTNSPKGIVEGGAGGTGRGRQVDHQVSPGDDDWRGWEAFLTVWKGRGFRLKPTTAQRDALWPVIDAYPVSAIRWVQEAPGTKSHDVVAYVLAEYDAARAEGNHQAALAEAEADARRHAQVRTPITAPVPIGDLLKAQVN